MEQQIKLAAKLYQCRDTAKKLYGEKFNDKMSVYKTYIYAAMAKHKVGELEAAKRLATLVDDGIIIMNLMAAAVEIIEHEET